MDSILLHTCCSPCVCHPLEYLLARGWSVSLFFYNPNIYPSAEYEHRLAELKKYLNKFSGVPLIAGDYDHDAWLAQIRGWENEPERGARCDVCYKLRLRDTAVLARQRGFDYFGSTLSISPHKKADKISELGHLLSAEYGVKFFDQDWKKMDGFKHACDIVRREGFYRQNYCGCEFSRPKDRDRHIE